MILGIFFWISLVLFIVSAITWYVNNDIHTPPIEKIVAIPATYLFGGLTLVIGLLWL